MSCINAPVGTLSQEQVGRVLTLADLAPEVHHSRPWTFHCSPTSIDLLLALPADPWGPTGDHREALVAAGAALLNLRLAVRSCGVDPVVRLLPQLDRPTLLATVEIDGRRPSESDSAELIMAIRLLQTRTRRFTADPIPETAMVELRSAARIEQSWFALLAAADMRQIGAVIGDFGEFPLLDACAHVAVVGTLQDDPASHLRAGQAMQRVLLTAARSGLGSRFLTLTSVSSGSRQHVRELIGGALWPQAILQIGCAAG